MKEFLGMFKELYFGTIDMWKNDRREFWEVYLGMTLFVIIFWFCFWVLIPIVGN
jgi:hypothetical protein